eukprot:COSAG02_NODE_2212_length_9491_cov_210.102215_12_plen_66_part_00
MPHFGETMRECQKNFRHSFDGPNAPGLFYPISVSNLLQFYNESTVLDLHVVEIRVQTLKWPLSHW